MKYLMAVTDRTKNATHGVIFDRIGGVTEKTHLYLVAWASGNISPESWTDITFVRFLSTEVEANHWLKET